MLLALKFDTKIWCLHNRVLVLLLTIDLFFEAKIHHIGFLRNRKDLTDAPCFSIFLNSQRQEWCLKNAGEKQLPEPILSGSSSPVSILARMFLLHFKKASSTAWPVLAEVSRNISPFSWANLDRVQLWIFFYKATEDISVLKGRHLLSLDTFFELRKIVQ